MNAAKGRSERNPQQQQQQDGPSLLKELSTRFPEIPFSSMSEKYIFIDRWNERKGRDAFPPAVAALIPRGKKYFVWFTFLQTWNVCVFVDAISKKMFFFRCTHKHHPLFYGTILYGTFLPKDRSLNGTTPATHPGDFVAEDIFFYQGRPIGDYLDDKRDGSGGGEVQAYKLEYIFRTVGEISTVVFQPGKANERKIDLWMVPVVLVEDLEKNNNPYEGFLRRETVQKYFILESGAKGNSGGSGSGRSAASATETPSSLKRTAETMTNHVRGNDRSPSSPVKRVCRRTNFWVTADLRSDIYYLYPEFNSTEESCVGIAHIPDLRTSKYMNSVFRCIRENENLDFAELSDSEEDFQDIRVDKFVNLSERKNLAFEYNEKFRRWCPIF